MELTIVDATPNEFRAGYTCACGCAPSVAYERGSDVVAEGCCCGNQFVVGPQASTTLALVDGFRLESTPFSAPWGEGIEAAWLVGPSAHGPASEHDHSGGEHDHGDEARPSVIDPVRGMTVEPEAARAKGLHSSYQGRDFFFCGKGCKLEFDDEPGRYLDPAYMPSM